MGGIRDHDIKLYNSDSSKFMHRLKDTRGSEWVPVGRENELARFREVKEGSRGEGSA